MSSSTDQRYPLCWPEKWPRIAPCARRVSRFRGQTISSSWDALLFELRRLTGGNVWTLSTNIPLLRNGTPAGTLSKRLADPGAAVYFEINKRPVSLACDKWLDVEDNIYAIAKHIEALRGQDRWGVGTIEQAFRGYMALPGVGETGGLQWWTTLGVPINSTTQQVREAYLVLVKKHHPDRQGGSREMFERVQIAWEQFEVNSGLKAA